MKLMEMSKNMIKDNWLWADQQWDDIAKKNWKLSILKFPSPREQLEIERLSGVHHENF